MPAILGKKLGMTLVFTEDGESVPVTVIEAGPCKVTAVRSDAEDGYSAVQLAWGEVAERKLTRAELGHLKAAEAPPMKHLVEFRNLDRDSTVGDEVTVAEFEEGQ
jgi:large subunit ribosomal protein L3